MFARNCSALMLALSCTLLIVVPARPEPEPAVGEDAAAEFVGRLAGQARTETRAFRAAGGEYGDPKHPALKWSQLIWEYRLAHPGTRAAQRAAEEAVRLLLGAGHPNEMYARASALEPDDPALISALETLSFEAHNGQDWQRFIEFVDSVLARSASKDIRAAAYYARYGVLRTANRPAEAKADLRAAIAEAPDSWGGKKAKQSLYGWENLNVGQPAPSFTAPAVDGRSIRLSDYRGKVVLFDFWATWCAPCVGHLPALLTLADKYEGQGFAVIGVSVDTERAKLERMVAEKEIPWPQIFDANGMDGEVPKLFDIEGLPVYYLVDREGRILGRFVNPEELERNLAAILD